MFAGIALITTFSNSYAPLPDREMEVGRGRAALVGTDSQNDFLGPKGVTWGVVGKSVEANNTVENIATLRKAAKANDVPRFMCWPRSVGYPGVSTAG